MPSVDTHRGFLLPVPPYQLFPSGGFDLHTSWATVSDGPFFCPRDEGYRLAAERLLLRFHDANHFSGDGDCAPGDIEAGILSQVGAEYPLDEIAAAHAENGVRPLDGEYPSDSLDEGQSCGMQTVLPKAA